VSASRGLQLANWTAPARLAIPVLMLIRSPRGTIWLACSVAPLAKRQKGICWWKVRRSPARRMARLGALEPRLGVSRRLPGI
jgi:hypothetical protein